MTMETAVTKVEKLLREKRELLLEGDWLERYRAIKAEISDIKSEVDLETFAAIIDVEMAGLDVNEPGRASMRQVCYCGHRRGSHSSSGCHIGHEKWNKRYRRNDPYCDCRGFIEKAEFERAEAEAEADLAERKANADVWCETCDDEVDESTVKYECGNCGSEFTYADEGTHRCPDCGKFASKLDGDYCPGCGEEVNDGS